MGTPNSTMQSSRRKTKVSSGVPGRGICYISVVVLGQNKKEEEYEQKKGAPHLLVGSGQTQFVYPTNLILKVPLLLLKTSQFNDITL